MKYLKNLFKGLFSKKPKEDEKTAETPPVTEKPESSPPEKITDQSLKTESSSTKQIKKKTSKLRVKQQPREERDLVIGFDLGTSFTKVVIRDTAIKKSYAIEFEEIVSIDSKYLIPTQIYSNENGGQYSLTEGDVLRTNLKLEMMSEDARQEVMPKVYIANFIGLVIREAIKNFLVQNKEIYMNADIIWSLNLGIPSRWFDDDDLIHIFKTVGYAGWIISEDAHEATTPKAKAALEKADELLKQSTPSPDSNKYKLHLDNLYITPEIIAEVVGYSKSYLRNFGLHGIIDIGAGTFDISTFVLHSNQEGDLFSILRSEVKLLGVFEFEDAKNQGGTSLGDFKKKCNVLIQRVIMETYQNGDPNSPNWTNGLPLFICGGGSEVSVYKNLISKSETVLKNAIRFEGFKRMTLPLPEDLEIDTPSKLYHRMAVAYGLSYTSWNIGDIRPPGSIDDLPGSSPTSPNKPYKPIKPSTHKTEFKRNKKVQDKERGY